MTRGTANRPGLLLLAVICAVLPLGACDCEDTVRSWLDERRETEPKPTGDAGARESSTEPVEVEPNESPDNATPIELTSELRAVRGTLADPSDTDWYGFTQDDDDPWLLDITVEPDAFDAVVELAIESEGGSAPPLTYDVAGPGAPEVVQTVPVAARPLKIGVKSKAGTGDYSIRFTKRLSGGATEQEPNDLPARAFTFEAPGELQGFIDRPDDRDIFAIAAEKEVVAGLEVVAPPGVALVVRMFDDPSFATPLVALNVAAGGRASLPNVGLERRREDEEPILYLVVTSASGHSRERGYRVRMTPRPPSTRPQELEPNDTRPMPLETPQITLEGTLHAPDDVDRFAWGYWEDLAGPDAGRPDAATVDAAVEASADAGRGVDAADVDGGARDRLWAMLPQKPEPRPVSQLVVEPLVDWVTLGVEWRDDEDRLTRRAPAAGKPVRLCARTLMRDRFRFSVRASEFAAPRDGVIAGYRVVLTQPPTTSLESEPNNTLAEAERLEPGSERTAYLGTVDDVDTWGTVVVAPSDDPYATERFEAKLEAREHDLMVQLKDEEGGIVADIDRAGPGGGETVAVDLPEGLYYLLVRTKSGGSCEPYTITLP